MELFFFVALLVWEELVGEVGDMVIFVATMHAVWVHQLLRGCPFLTSLEKDVEDLQAPVSPLFALVNGLVKVMEMEPPQLVTSLEFGYSGCVFWGYTVFPPRPSQNSQDVHLKADPQYLKVHQERQHFPMLPPGPDLYWRSDSGEFPPDHQHPPTHLTIHTGAPSHWVYLFEGPVYPPPARCAELFG